MLDKSKTGWATDEICVIIGVKDYSAVREIPDSGGFQDID